MNIDVLPEKPHRAWAEIESQESGRFGTKSTTNLLQCSDFTVQSPNFRSLNCLNPKEKYGGAGRSRTGDLRFRKPPLYPSELQPRVVKPQV
jgi:hypothetical protein